MAMCRSAMLLLAAWTTLATFSSKAVAQALPPDVVQLFASLGISVDENGVPIPPPPPVTPAPPVEPMSNEELAALLGIPVEILNGEPLPTPPEPIVPPAPVEPLTPEELAELLGLPVELFLEPPTPPVAVDPIPVAPPSPSPVPTITDEELADLLGIPYEQLFPIAVVQPPDLTPPPVTPLTEDESLTLEELFASLGLTGVLPTPTAMTASQFAAVQQLVGVPEPASVGLVFFGLVAGAWRRC